VANALSANQQITIAALLDRLEADYASAEKASDNQREVLQKVCYGYCLFESLRTKWWIQKQEEDHIAGETIRAASLSTMKKSKKRTLSEADLTGAENDENSTPEPSTKLRKGDTLDAKFNKVMDMTTDMMGVVKDIRDGSQERNGYFKRYLENRN
jgi:hypothetical protein